MKTLFSIMAISLAAFMISCGGNAGKKSSESAEADAIETVDSTACCNKEACCKGDAEKCAEGCECGEECAEGCVCAEKCAEQCAEKEVCCEGHAEEGAEPAADAE